jgi:hypothetical protein
MKLPRKSSCSTIGPARNRAVGPFDRGSHRAAAMPQGAPLRLKCRADRRTAPQWPGNRLCVQEPGNTSVKRKHRQPVWGRVIIICGRAADISDLTEPSEAVRRRADGSGHARRAEPGQWCTLQASSA